VREPGTRPDAPRSGWAAGEIATPAPRRSLPPQRRSRSLARLEAEIVRSGTACTRWRTRAEGLEAAGRGGRQVRGLLHVAEGRLAQLHRSREVLLRGEEGHEDNEPEHQP
jgi:hypothetical protein